MVTLQMSNKKRRRPLPSPAAPARPPGTSPNAAVPPPKASSTLETTNITLQECSFVQWDIPGITSIAAHPESTLLAVARTNGTIELRSRHLNFSTTSLIRSHSALDHSVTALKFSPCGEHLFVSRLDASLSILYLTHEGLSPCTKLVPGGGAIWDIDVHQIDANGACTIAVACDDGRVRLIRPDPGINQNAKFPRDPAQYIITASEPTKARVLSVSLMSAKEEGSGAYVVCGDAHGALRWINVENGSVFARGKIPSLRGKCAMIWTVQMVKGGREVICGDSRGKVTVWDAVTATRVQEVEIEGVEGVIWSSVVTGGEGREAMVVGCAGGGIGGVQLMEEKDGEGGEWVPFRGTRLHSHDVRGMGCFPDGRIATGSLDGRICVFSVEDLMQKRKVHWVLPYPAGIEQGVVQFCRNKGLVVSRRKGGLDLWFIPEGEDRPELKLRMKLGSLESDVISCGLSADGRFLGVASWDGFRLYEIWDGVGEVGTSLTFGKVKSIEIGGNVEHSLSGVEDMAFCGQKLVCVTSGGAGLAMVADGAITEWSRGMIGSKSQSLGRVACGEDKIVVSDYRGEVFMGKFAKGRCVFPKDMIWKRILAKSQKVGRVTAMDVSPSGRMVGIATSDLTVHVYDSEACVTSEMKVLQKVRAVVTSLSFAGSEESIVVSGERFCHICKIHQGEGKKRKNVEVKKRKIGSHHGLQIFNLEFKDSVLGACVAGESRLLVVRRPWTFVPSSLPDAILKKPYGA